MSSPAMLSRFFTDIDGTLIFKQQNFVFVVGSREFLPDSYTAFKNRIGLSDHQRHLLSSYRDVVLAFPYKDCVLEGGQTKEDQKRTEIFYNTTLAPESVDCLLAPKVFTAARRYTSTGNEPATDFRSDDNLLIKGNNLLALSSLLGRFAGKVRCIYIDPPYNTGSDSFEYNDRFNHSTWLSFMRNRLEIAWRLLSNEGTIWINLDDNEVHYLKVLCDEIFSRENFIGSVSWKKTTGDNKTSFVYIHDSILIYPRIPPKVTL